MKKILAGTTAFISIMAGSAFAQDESKFNLKMHGLATVEYGMRKQKSAYTRNIPKETPVINGVNSGDKELSGSLSTNKKNSAFYNEARFSVEASAMADAGFTYGGVIGLATTAKAQGGKNSSTNDNTYAFVESSMGRVEVGSNYSASKTMGFSGGTVARGTGGATGDYDNFITTNFYDAKNNKALIIEQNNLTTNVVSKTTPSFLTGNGLMGDAYRASGSSEQPNRITYYTPMVAGLQLGVTYTPDSDKLGSGKAYLESYSTTRTMKDLVNVGLKYTQDFDQITLGLSAIGAMGTVKKNETDIKTNHNFTGYSLGGLASYGSFSLSGNWGTMNKKFFTYDDAAVGTAEHAQTAKTPTFYSAAVSYVQGPFGVSVNYYNSTNYNKNKYTAYGVSADYQLAPGMSTFAEYVHFNAKPDAKLTGVTTKNVGNVFLVGTSFSF